MMTENKFIASPDVFIAEISVRQNDSKKEMKARGELTHSST